MATPSVETPLNKVYPQANSENLGVYLRNDGTPSSSSQKELDVLWSQQSDASTLTHIKEDHHPLLTFVAGFLAGAMLSGLFFWVFNARPQTPALNAVAEAPALVESPAQPTESKTVETSPEKAIAKGTFYKVKPDDTLGGIAHKFYGSYSPIYINRLRKANNLKGDNLRLNQELVIPPKNYDAL
jgi:LysM repeat protein